MKLQDLSNRIQHLHDIFAREAGRSVDIALTLRNWLIGYYIKEYEQNGSDRAEYGTKLLNNLAHDLESAKIPATSSSSLKFYRQFYASYLQIGTYITGRRHNLLVKISLPEVIGQALPSQFKTTETSIHRDEVPSLPIEQLVNNLSYSHFVELMKIDDPLKRSFYEIESIRSNWGTKELRRQISSLYYERLGLSKNKANIAKMVETGTYAHDIKDVIRDPYMFEFVGINKDEVTEASLSTSLIRQLNKFFLEMGKGFCFEASNKKILVGDTYFFIDIVLYHRVLKCSVLIELKLDSLNHHNIGQLNTYVNYYKKHEMYPGDNPPIGLLLCTEKNEALAEYALGGMDNQLFISKYKLELPSQIEIKNFIENKLKELTDK